MPRTTAYLFALPALVASGCLISVPLEGKRCDDDHPCVDGFYCVVGLCLAGAADAGHGVDAGRTSDAGPPDAGFAEDAGVHVDAGSDDDAGLAEDAGVHVDAGAEDDAGLVEDAGVNVDAGLNARVSDGLVALYVFDEGEGTTLHDVSGASPAIDLDVSGATSWTQTGLNFDSGGGIAASATSPNRIIEACKASGAVTLEAWYTPTSVAKPDQRLVTLSDDTSYQNMTLLLDTGVSAFRSRTNQVNSAIDRPGRLLAQNAVRRHSVATHEIDKSVIAHWTDGLLDAVRHQPGSSYSNWFSTAKLAIGNEQTQDRSFSGEIHLVAVYCRALSEVEVRQNYAAGSRAGPAVLPDATLVEGIVLDLPLAAAAGSWFTITATPVNASADLTFGLAPADASFADPSSDPTQVLFPASAGAGTVLVRVPLSAAPGSNVSFVSPFPITGLSTVSVLAPTLTAQVVDGESYQVPEGFVLDAPIDTSAVAADIATEMAALAFPSAASAYPGQLYVGATSPSRVYQVTDNALTLLATGDGSTGPDDGMSQIHFAPPSSGYGDHLYVCASSADAGDGVFRLSAAGTFSVFNPVNNCNGMMFDVDGRFSDAQVKNAMYVNVNATEFGFVSTGGDLTLYDPVLPLTSSGYRLVPMRGVSAFNSVVLALDPAGGTLWSTDSLDDASPAQRMMNLDDPRGLVESKGLAFGSGALLSEAGAGRVSMVRSGYQSVPVLTGIQGPTALGTPEGVVDAEVWILESGRGRILRLRPMGP